jgi:hypothetical protein
MTISGDPTLQALDAVSEELRTIYDAKRDGTATAKDDFRLKKLHVEWMAIIRKIGSGEGEGTNPNAAKAFTQYSREEPFGNRKTFPKTGEG